jgi:CheY-like chemotaxis protein
MLQVAIVDDSEDDREMLRRWLEEGGHEVRPFACGKTALAALIKDTPDVLVLDLSMPEMDGFSLLDAARAYRPLKDLPVVIWTGVSDSQALARARALKVSAVLTKSLTDLVDLRTAIEKAAEGSPRQ